MRFIDKGTAPAAFLAWRDQADEEWQPSYRDLRNPQKQTLKEALLAEQGGLCCYCGRQVSVDNSHIEHFRPQGRYQALALAYENLHASCLRDRKADIPLHCGHAKDEQFDEARQISPLDADCEQRFLYTMLGEIVPTDRDDAPAIYMIEILALDSPVLNAQRLDVLSRVFDDAFLATMTSEDLEALTQAYRRRDRDGKMEPFGHVVARHADGWMLDLA